MFTKKILYQGRIISVVRGAAGTDIGITGGVMIADIHPWANRRVQMGIIREYQQNIS